MAVIAARRASNRTIALIAGISSTRVSSSREGYTSHSQSDNQFLHETLQIHQRTQ